MHQTSHVLIADIERHSFAQDGQAMVERELFFASYDGLCPSVACFMVSLDQCDQASEGVQQPRRGLLADSRNSRNSVRRYARKFQKTRNQLRWYTVIFNHAVVLVGSAADHNPRLVIDQL